MSHKADFLGKDPLTRDKVSLGTRYYRLECPWGQDIVGQDKLVHLALRL